MSKVVLTINAWSTECGSCGYGRGGWAASPARRGLPILTPDSRECPGCGERFTHVVNLYDRRGVLPLPPGGEAS